jgi:hypothetical protein
VKCQFNKGLVPFSPSAMQSGGVASPGAVAVK